MGAHSFGRVDLPPHVFADGGGVGDLAAQRRHNARDVGGLARPRLAHEEDLGRVSVISLCRSLPDLLLPFVQTLDTVKANSYSCVSVTSHAFIAN